ncbi:hypothetical protein Ddc_16802 [Ditylenchus destructor]|nr:hypothetical protein Ddc_16802 [Ditylenchus destructor]
MKYYFSLLILAIFSFSNALWSTIGQQKVIKKIIDEFRTDEFHVLGISCIFSKDLPKIVDEIFERLPERGPPTNLLILDRVKGIVFRSQSDQDLESNLLTPLLPPPKYEQAGEIAVENIYRFIGKLANRYVDLLKEEGEDKEIHVVPVAKVKNESIIFFGVLGKDTGTANNPTGISALIAQLK